MLTDDLIEFSKSGAWVSVNSKLPDGLYGWKRAFGWDSARWVIIIQNEIVMTTRLLDNKNMKGDSNHYELCSIDNFDFKLGEFCKLEFPE